ncbi:MAG: molybdopterin molybdenumtransferase MoeA, partial [Demequina sp.]
MTRSLAEHRAAAMALLSQMPTLDVLLGDAVGGMLAEDLVADAPVPAVAMAACDGYAIRVLDVAHASHSSPVTLSVSHDVDFDTRSRRRHVAGTAATVVSGVPLPEGADAVVRAADTDGGLARVAVTRAAGPGENVRPAGADAASGEVVVARGTRIGPRQLGVAAALGRSRLVV